MIVARGMYLEARYLLMELIGVMKVGQECSVMRNYVLILVIIGEYAITVLAIV